MGRNRKLFLNFVLGMKMKSMHTLHKNNFHSTLGRYFTANDGYTQLLWLFGDHPLITNLNRSNIYHISMNTFTNYGFFENREVMETQYLSLAQNLNRFIDNFFLRSISRFNYQIFQEFFVSFIQRSHVVFTRFTP